MAEPICCTNCGFRIEDQEGISFCPSCGTKIGVDTAPRIDADGNCTITVRYPSVPADIGGRFSYFGISIDGRDRYKSALPGNNMNYSVPPGTHTITVRQFNSGITAHVTRATMELTVK